MACSKNSKRSMMESCSEVNLKGLPPRPSLRQRDSCYPYALAAAKDRPKSPSDSDTNTSNVDPTDNLLDLFPDGDAFRDALDSFLRNRCQNVNDADNRIPMENHLGQENKDVPSSAACMHIETTDNRSIAEDIRGSTEDLRKAADSGDILAQWRLKRKLEAKEISLGHISTKSNSNLNKSTSFNKTNENNSLPIITSSNSEYPRNQCSYNSESNSQLIHLMTMLLQKALDQPHPQKEIQGCHQTSRNVVLREIALQCHPTVADKISGPCQKTGKVHSNKSRPKTACRSVGIQFPFVSERISRESQTRRPLKCASIATQCDLQPSDSALVQKPKLEKGQPLISPRGNGSEFEENIATTDPGSTFIPALHNTPPSSFTTISSLSASPKGSIYRAAELDDHLCAHSDYTNVNNTFCQKHIQLNDDLLEELLKARSSCAKKLKIVQKVLQRKREETKVIH